MKTSYPPREEAGHSFALFCFFVVGVCQRARAEERVHTNKEEWADFKSEGCTFIHKKMLLLNS